MLELRRLHIVSLLFIVHCTLFINSISAQNFFNLTADEVKIDSVLPAFNLQQPLGPNYADSVYQVSILYPEFMPMSEADVARYQALTSERPAVLPKITQHISVVRRQGFLNLSFVPIAFRDGKYQKLVSFMLDVKATPVAAGRRVAAAAPQQRYTSQSVLASGRWVKIRIPETGVYHLSDALVRQAGFSTPARVRIYGYGGAMQPEVLTADYLMQTDDLQEVPTCTVNGRRLFYGVGPVNWELSNAVARTRNPYSDYGYYFLTEAEGTPLTVDSAAFVASCYPMANDYHELYEVDNYAWYHGGRNLYDSEKLVIGTPRNIPMSAVADSVVWVDMNLSFDKTFDATLLLNGTVLGTLKPSTSVVTSGGLPRDGLALAAQQTWSFKLPVAAINHDGKNIFSLLMTSGSEVRLDWLSLRYQHPKALDLTSNKLPVPEVVYGITNQNHHADPAADMVIIIPASQKFLSQALRLKALHETYDSLRVNIVPADELYNEFSSGTPDANAYRRYMKMLYDRAETAADQPRYLLLFGDGAWDNRMLTSDWRNESADDYLLCYESDNSFSQFYCYVTDDYFGLLDDGEGADVSRAGIDVAVGRLSARTLAQATAMVDKIIDYRTNNHAAAWQNTICILGDDGDSNRHMQDAESVANVVATRYPSYDLKKIYWDAYTRESTSTGNRYPEVEKLVRQQMQRGALVMNYSGHGSVYIMSHEQAVKKEFFSEHMSLNLPLWVTASCDIMPFDGQEENFGELAMYNDYGGAVAFFGTTRTVYANYNCMLNKTFMNHVLSTDANGRRMTMGEAVMKAKNTYVSSYTEMERINKMHYTLLGDPALALAAPTLKAVIDSINGAPATGMQQLKAGSVVTVKGHIDGHPQFKGLATLTVRDQEETVTCRRNDPSLDVAFTFKERPNTIYTGRDSVQNGTFTFQFSVPQDISYSDQAGLMLIYAVSNDKTLEAHGINSAFHLSGSEGSANDGIGPSVYCYLNSEHFMNGGTVNATPYFYAELSDKDGINVAGSGIGHDLELVIDGDMNMTYNLNDAFQYDFGDYRTGRVGYSLPTLADGPHKLLFRAWDVLNNATTAELQFTVEAQQEPLLRSVVCTKNPATTYTQFLITHDRTGSQMDVELEVFDASGRKLWGRVETGIPTDQTYTIDWDLTSSSGSRLRTGVYLYRVLISSNGSRQVSEAKKLIVLGNN